MDYSSLTDEQLAKKVQENDQKALSELIGRYQNKLYYYILKMTRNHDESLDIVQDTFIKVYENIQSFDVEKKFSSWIYRIAHNHAVNQLKKKSRIIKMEIPQEEWFLTNKEEGDDSLSRLEKEELTKEMFKKIDTLRQEYRDVILLYYFEEKNYEEISDILMIPSSTVGVWLSRAKRALKERLL